MFAKSYHWFFNTVIQFTLSHPYFLKMYISVIIHKHTIFPWPIPLQILLHVLRVHLSHVCHIPRVHVHFFILIFDKKYKLSDYSLCSFLQHSVISSLTETLHILLNCLGLCCDKNAYEFASLQIPVNTGQ